MMYRLAVYRGRDADGPRFAIIPVRQTNLVEIEKQFSSTRLDRSIQILDYSQRHFSVGESLRASGEHANFTSPSDWSLELTRAVMVHFLFVTVMFLLLFTILVKSRYFPRFAGGSRPRLSANWRGFHGQSNGLTSILIRSCSH
jgi:hypothetical protein